MLKFRLLKTSSCFEGASVSKVSETKLPYGQLPIMLHNGEVSLQTSSGKVTTLPLDSHNLDEKPQDLNPEQVSQAFIRVSQ